MRQKDPSRGRTGRVVVGRTGARWTAQVEIDDRQGEHVSRVRLDLPGTFGDEASAKRAAESVLGEWRCGRVALRELVLRELAATYRRLRERHKVMEPATVPRTGVAWEHTLALWELAGWLDGAEVVRYREHARLAFDATAAPVTRHRLLDLESDLPS